MVRWEGLIGVGTEALGAVALHYIILGAQSLSKIQRKREKKTFLLEQVLPSPCEGSLDVGRHVCQTYGERLGGWLVGLLGGAHSPPAPGQGATGSRLQGFDHYRIEQNRGYHNSHNMGVNLG